MSQVAVEAAEVERDKKTQKIHVPPGATTIKDKLRLILNFSTRITMTVS